MSTQYSTSLRFWMGQQNDPAIANNWGTPNSFNFTLIDSAIAGTASVSLTGLTTYSLTTANGAADQSRELVQDYIGALGATCTVTLPNVPKIGWARNDTTGGHNVIETAGAGTTATLAPDGYWYFRATDGATNALLPNVAFNGVKVGGALTVAGAATISGGLATNLVGTTTNDNAPAGDVGQFISAVVPAASAVALASTVAVNITGFSLTAGDWDVRAEVWFTATAGVTEVIAGFGPSSGAFTTDPVIGAARTELISGQLTPLILPAGPTRVSLTTTTTIFMNALANFGSGTAKAYGKIEARRVR